MIPRACMRCEASPGHAHAHARHQPFPHSVWARSLTDRPGNMEGKCSVKKRFFNEASPRNTVWPVSRHVAGPLGMGGIVEHGPLRSPIEPGVSLPRDRGCSPAERSLASRRLAGRSLASRRLVPRSAPGTPRGATRDAVSRGARRRARRRDAASRRAVSRGARRRAGYEPEKRTPRCQDAATARVGARYRRRGAACPCTGRQRVLWRWVLLA
jgi:hypothetical protein